MKKITYRGNPFIGLHITASDDLVIVPTDISDKLYYPITEELKTNVIRLNVVDANLNGIYVSMFKDILFLPSIVDDHIKKELENYVNVYVLDTKFNALGNNIVFNNKACIVNPNMEKEIVNEIKDVLNVEVFPVYLNNIPTVGSLLRLTSKGFVTSYKLRDNEFNFIKEIFHVNGARGSVNLGVEYISLGLVANKHGYIVGELTTGIEMNNIDDGLGFL